jgi:putative SOS response-associated peptidase YedK
MCVNYRPSTPERIQQRYALDVPSEYRVETWKGYSAPIILNREGATKVILAEFGLIPPWCKTAADAKKLTSGTMNCRSETVAEKPSFRSSWQKQHFALIPMSAFFEPNYESGKAERWSIAMADGQDFAVGGIWSWWKSPETGEGRASFSLLTLNADDHPVLKRFHKPGDEKRSLFIVPETEYTDWLTATPDKARSMLRLLPPECLVARKEIRERVDPA